MRVELTGRHVDITPVLRCLVDTKLAKLERLLNDSAVSAQALLVREKIRHRTEITLHARGERFLQERKRLRGASVPRETPEAIAAKPASGARARPARPRVVRAGRKAIKPFSVADAARVRDALSSKPKRQ